MSTEYEDRISTQVLTLQDADLAEEEADSTSDCEGNMVSATHEGSEATHVSNQSARNARTVTPEIGLTDALGHDAMQNLLEACYNRLQTELLVSLHCGHGGLAAGGRKRVRA